MCENNGKLIVAAKSGRRPLRAPARIPEKGDLEFGELDWMSSCSPIEDKSGIGTVNGRDGPHVWHHQQPILRALFTTARLAYQDKLPSAQETLAKQPRSLVIMEVSSRNSALY